MVGAIDRSEMFRRERSIMDARAAMADQKPFDAYMKQFRHGR